MVEYSIVSFLLCLLRMESFQFLKISEGWVNVICQGNLTEIDALISFNFDFDNFLFSTPLIWKSTLDFEPRLY